MAEPTSTPSPAAPWGRLAVTLLLVPAVAMLPAIGLPGVDGGAVEHAQRDGADPGVFALGIAPLVEASCLVELVAAIVPRWRPLRHGGPAGRGKLVRAALAVALALCVVEGLGITTLLASGHAPIAILTLTAGTCILALAAELGGAYGLTGGLALLYVGQRIVAQIRALVPSVMRKDASPSDLATLAVCSALVAGATWYVLRPRDATPARADEPGYRAAPGSMSPARLLDIPVPASGVAPLVVAASLLMLPATLSQLGLPLGGLARALQRDAVFQPAYLGLIVLVGIALSWAWNRPASVAALLAHAGRGDRTLDDLEAEARAGLREAVLRTALFLVGLVAIAEIARRVTYHALDAVALALGTALALDAAAELRARRAAPDLVAVWPEHRPYAIATERAVLAAAGIAVHARGERLRALLQFFGPFAPIELMVPRADAERAAELLGEALLARKGPEVEEAPAPLGRDAVKARPLRYTEKRVVLVTAGLVLAVLAMPIMSVKPATPHPPARPDAMQLLAVDDAPDPFGAAGVAVPRGVSIQLENVPDGPDGSASRHFARMVASDGEGLEQARSRLVAWAEAFPLPEGDRVRVGAVSEYDDDEDRMGIIGYRTYLVKGSPIVDGADVEDADAQVDAAGSRGATQGARVLIRLRAAGAERFRAFTAANVRRRLAIVVDGQIESATVILAEIPSGAVSISMGKGDPAQQIADAKRLADRLLGREAPGAHDDLR